MAHTIDLALKGGSFGAATICALNKTTEYTCLDASNIIEDFLKTVQNSSSLQKRQF
uniref:Uncharacterized protein n=1 Tax=Meloidogyne incognita TaxID=6306 RepID=A0A914M1K8_MELIC